MEEQKSEDTSVDSVEDGNAEAAEEVSAGVLNSEVTETAVENKAEDLVVDMPTTEDIKSEEKTEDFDELELL